MLETSVFKETVSELSWMCFKQRYKIVFPWLKSKFFDVSKKFRITSLKTVFITNKAFDSAYIKHNYKFINIILATRYLANVDWII